MKRMKYIIWGTGSYCKNKLEYWDKSKQIVAYVDRTKHFFKNQETIMPSEIAKIEYDYIVVMSSSYLEIMQEIIEAGIDYKKIIPGIVIKPYSFSELEKMNYKSKVQVTKEGFIEYKIDDFKAIIKTNDDWNCVKQYLCREKNLEYIQKLKLQPVGRTFGYSRGSSISRYYIEKFLGANIHYIKGNILEIGDNQYTQKYGASDSVSYVFRYGEGQNYYDKENNVNVVYGNLEKEVNVEDVKFDCIILTQVLDMIFDIKNAIKNVKHLLCEGGVILLTVSGITPISRSDMDRYGHYWCFTNKAIETLLNDDWYHSEVYTYGNAKVACAFIQGMSSEELTKEELDYCDEEFQVMLSAVCRRR